VKKTLSILAVLGFFNGLGGGLIYGIVDLAGQRYLSGRHWRLAWLTVVRDLRRGVLIGLAAAAGLAALAWMFRFLWRRIFRRYWEVRIRTVRRPRLFEAFGHLIGRWRRFTAPVERFVGGWGTGKSKWKVGGAAVLVGAFLVSPALEGLFPPPGPNVLLVVADALRPDRLGCYGSTAGLTPNIDRAAADGLVFEEAMSSAPWTKPAMGSLMASLYPHEHGAYHLPDSLSRQVTTLAEAFRDKGYATFGIQKNACIGASYGFGQGFDAYIDATDMPETEILSFFERRIRRTGRRPFFAYLHFMGTHIPFQSDEALDPKFALGENHGVDIRILTQLGLAEADKNRIRALYDKAVAAFDGHFGALLEALRGRGAEAGTIVVLTADHGEELWDHGFFEHGHTLYNELLRVPLVLRSPGRFSPGRVAFLLQHLDLYPFLLGQAGIRVPAGIRGRDFSAGLGGGPFVLRDEWFFEGLLFGPSRKAVIRGRWKLIENRSEMSPKALPWFGPLTPYLPAPILPSWELYDLEADPGEREDVASAHPEVVRQLKRRLDLFKMKWARVPPASNRTLSEREKDKLRSLGYIK